MKSLLTREVNSQVLFLRLKFAPSRHAIIYLPPSYPDRLIHVNTRPPIPTVYLYLHSTYLHTLISEIGHLQDYNQENCLKPGKRNIFIL